MSILINQFIPHSPSLPVSKCPFSKSASPFLPWKYIHLYYLHHYIEIIDMNLIVVVELVVEIELYLIIDMDNTIEYIEDYKYFVQN